MQRLAFALVFVLSACGTDSSDSGDAPEALDEEAFVAANAEVQCERLFECESSYAEGVWADMDDCVADMTLSSQQVLDVASDDGCSFDEGRAADCVDTLSTADCEEITNGSAYTDCNAIISCD